MAEQSVEQKKMSGDNGRRQGQERGSTEERQQTATEIERSGRHSEKGLARGGYAPSVFSLNPLSLLSMSPFALMRRFSEEMDQIHASFTGGAGEGPGTSSLRG